MHNDINLINFIDTSLEEKKMILEWRNHPNIRKWMYNQKIIDLSSHLAFIDSLRYSQDKLYFLVKKAEQYIGVIDFTKIDHNNKSAYFGLYANPYCKLAGIGRILETISIDYAFNTLHLTVLKLEVLSNNIQVRNLHKKFHFQELGTKMINDKEVIYMELTYENR
ncbi:MAG: UDP-4-amino-4,6-dideoxy-N-acetyl-beta-L-altrosamine N-acetyltransferase [Hydrogenimonas sp.]|nr:MAG: UDP-4-amino-4,6-dideoxy-N-acetyl-beta-L-altrosamine N-acetyltransferase [Hydrogenimonas sp.]